MSPYPIDIVRRDVLKKPTDPETLVLESWAQGLLFGSLTILGFVTLANMRKGVLLHKLIVLELVLGLWQGFWLFFQFPVYAWWLSIAAIFLNASWSLHNLISWMKIRLFLPQWASRTLISTLIIVQVYWILEVYANFAYFHGINNIFLHTRPWEALFRDPWWIITTLYLFWIIKTGYNLTLSEVVRYSPRFGVMLLAMTISVVFVVLDILTVTNALNFSGTTGINPFWKLAMVFKCLTDTVILDDFKTALDNLIKIKTRQLDNQHWTRDANNDDNNGDCDDGLSLRWRASRLVENERHEAGPDSDLTRLTDLPPRPEQALQISKEVVFHIEHAKIS